MWREHGRLKPPVRLALRTISTSTSRVTYFEWFGLTYRLEVPENNMEGCNIVDRYLDRAKYDPISNHRIHEETICISLALEQLQRLQGPPTAQKQNVPRHFVWRNRYGHHWQSWCRGARDVGGISPSRGDYAASHLQLSEF